MNMRGQLSVRYITTLCLLATGIYGQKMERSDRIDTGDTLCVGACVTSVHELRCETPTVPLFRPAKGCYACCFSDDHADDWADHINWGGEKHPEGEKS
ncbi:hypothetical protein ANOM_003338 [Aspergillus nomiae NRRL 13137]|uniref:Uncharacterized protein n=1 Tax=Aspergillus nomiae NRRL (strain ATCC 15546 / NRRL 13137 / CBS 260.88 / M93) TaxID=1509407 RepID=A0A0L1J979_ASPN3|nr:uncharacterized protein ANOM_003338 [Aspergillus nomiae NRRL 13137]KNG88366.1 hypothetical protein ANOM_003338 [Aspergillus nomiae NRRL 13137]